MAIRAQNVLRLCFSKSFLVVTRMFADGYRRRNSEAHCSVTVSYTHLYSTLSLYMSDKVKIISGLSKCVCKASINIKSGVDNTPATLISTIFERLVLIIHKK